MMDDAAIKAIVTRLARRHPSGGTVIERAAIMAEGEDSPAIISWITAHDGEPELLPQAGVAGGLHSGKMSGTTRIGSRPPLRYVLPPGTLT